MNAFLLSYCFFLLSRVVVRVFDVERYAETCVIPLLPTHCDNNYFFERRVMVRRFTPYPDDATNADDDDDNNNADDDGGDGENDEANQQTSSSKKRSRRDDESNATAATTASSKRRNVLTSRFRLLVDRSSFLSYRFFDTLVVCAFLHREQSRTAARARVVERRALVKKKAACECFDPVCRR
jgi:hypothetical protein